MNTFQKRILAFVVIGFAMVSAIYIAIPRDAVVHTAYGTLLLAVILSGGVLWQLSQSTRANYLTSWAFPLALKSYLGLTIAMAVIFVALDLAQIWSISFTLYAALQVLILGITGWKMLSIATGQEVIQNTGAQVQEKVVNWRMLLADADAILQSTPAQFKKDIQAVRDAIRYTSPMSIPAVASQERDIYEGLVSLRQLINDKDADADKIAAMCTRIQNTIKDRANRLKVMR